MDDFLNEQMVGQLVDADNSFTICRMKARAKTLQSAPKTPESTWFRLIESALMEMGYQPGDCITHRPDSQQAKEFFRVVIRGMGKENVAALLDELRAPFGASRNTRRLAQALLLAASTNRAVDLCLVGSMMSYVGSHNRIQLVRPAFEVLESFGAHGPESVTITIPGVANAYASYLRSLSCSLLRTAGGPTEKILPFESLSSEVSGFFEGRVRPFTAIRSYAVLDEVEQAEAKDGRGLTFDLWEGPYTRLSESTLLLDKRPDTGFLFLRWKPNYGRPTFLHHALDAPLSYGPQSCRGTFMITSSETPAYVLLCSEGIVTDPVPVDGPVGLVGLVVWPGFRFDLWGTRPVKDAVYERALDWAQSQATATAKTLADHAEEVIARAVDSQILRASYYRDEVAARMRSLWGSQR